MDDKVVARFSFRKSCVDSVRIRWIMESSVTLIFFSSYTFLIYAIDLSFKRSLQWLKIYLVTTVSYEYVLVQQPQRFGESNLFCLQKHSCDSLKCHIIVKLLFLHFWKCYTIRSIMLTMSLISWKDTLSSLYINEIKRSRRTACAYLINSRDFIPRQSTFFIKPSN